MDSNLLDKLLGVSWPLEEQLDDGSQKLELNLGVLILEGVEEALQKLIGVVNTLCVLSNDPDHRSPSEIKSRMITVPGSILRL